MLSRVINAARHPVSSNTTAIIFVRGSTIGTRLLVLFVIARYVSPAEFGVVAYMLTVTEIAKVIADFGVDTYAIRTFAITKPDQQQAFARLVAVTKLLMGTAGYVILVAFFFLQVRPEAGLGATIGLLVLTGLWANLYIDYFQARLKVSMIVIPVMLNNVATIAAVALLFAVHPSVFMAVAVLPLAEAVNAWVLSRLFERELGLGRQHIPLAQVGNLLKHTLPLAATLIISMLYTRLDVLVLAAFFSATIVGFYGIAFRITEPFQLMAGAFVQSSYSYLSRALASGRQDVPRVAVRYGLGMLTYGALVCLSLEVFAPLVIQFALPDYVSAIPILRILGLALVFRSINAYLTSVLYAYGYFKWVTAVTTWNLFAVAGLLYAFLPVWGAIGAASALLLAEALNTVIQAIMTRQAFHRSEHPIVELSLPSA